MGSPKSSCKRSFPEVHLEVHPLCPAFAEIPYRPCRSPCLKTKWTFLSWDTPPK